MKVIEKECALIEVARLEGLRVFYLLRDKWPFSDEVASEHIWYALIFALKAFYEEKLCPDVSESQFLEVLNEILRIHL